VADHPLHAFLRTEIDRLKQSNPSVDQAQEIAFLEGIRAESEMMKDGGFFLSLLALNASVDFDLLDIKLSGVNGECLIIATNASGPAPGILAAGRPAPAMTGEGIRKAIGLIRDYALQGLRLDQAAVLADPRQHWLRKRYPSCFPEEVPAD
jgi:hypothetical protein